jgi:hypothetical protein
MANSIKILSWNIQKFGEDKLADANFMDYVCQVIQIYGADVVGLMELVGWKGNEIRDALVTRLDNIEKAKNGGLGSGITWQGEASEMTPSRPNEQYVFIWKKSLFSKFAVILWNVVGETAFSDYFKKYGVSATDQEKLWSSLFKNGYLDAAYMMPWSQFDTLLLNYKSLDLTKKAPTIALSDAQKKDLVDILIAETPEAFPKRGSRPPFLLRTRTATTPTDIIFLLFHAPGPGDALPMIASNQLSFIPDVQNTAVGVVMGDFNVGATEAAKQYALEYFDKTSGSLKYVKDAKGAFITGYPFQRLTGGAFASQASPNASLSAVQNYGKRLWTDKTSITTTLVNPQNTVASPTEVQKLLSSEYDKFFVRSPQADPSAPFVINLIDAMVPKSVQTGVDAFGNPVMTTVSTTATTYQPTLAALAQQVYNTWWAGQNGKKKKSSTTVQLLAQCPVPASSLLSLFQSHYVYRNAISDHLPILMELKYA